MKEDVTEDGNIFKLLVRGWDLLRTTFLVQRTQFGEGARFETKFVYPEQACREALINAIAHRDYSSQSGIDIFVFNERIEIRSPGALLSNIKIADLQGLNGAHESRNPLMARVLREHTHMRELGEGMRRMFEAMEQNDLEKPELVSSGGSFSVVLWNRSVFNQREEEWLALFHASGLSRLQKRIVVAGIDGKELSPADIYRAMNTEDRDTYDFEVTGLRKSGVLTEIRSTAAAQQMSRSRRVAKATIPRFKVVPAKSGSAETRKLRTQTVQGPKRELYPEETGVFIGNLDPSTTEEELRTILQRFGSVRKVLLKPDKRPGSSGQYAVLWLESAQQANKAIDVLYGFKLSGRELLVQKFRAQHSHTYRRHHTPSFSPGPNR